MATDLIRYDLMVQDAMRGVVRRVLSDVSRYGLPGDHHLYISFRTNHSGARLSNRLREDYPDEMTIVLQHQFWDLKASEHGFEVVLSFKNVQEQLVVPYEAIVGFFDPSVQFGLKFEAEDQAAPGAEPASSAPATTAKKPGDPSIAPRTPRRASDGKAEDNKTPALPASDSPAADGTDDAEAPKVVSLDAFRKKT